MKQRKSGATSTAYHQYLPLTRPIEEHEIPDVRLVDTSDHGNLETPEVSEKEIAETFAKEVKNHPKIIRCHKQVHEYVKEFNRLRAKQDELDKNVRELTTALSKAKAKATENKLRLRRIRSDIISICKAARTWRHRIFGWLTKRMLKGTYDVKSP